MANQDLEWQSMLQAAAQSNMSEIHDLGDELANNPNDQSAMDVLRSRCGLS